MARKRTKKEIVQDARRYLKAHWTKGYWVRYEGIGAWAPDDYPDREDGGLSELLALIERAKKKRANPNCEVCAEGAVYLACALAGDTDTTRAREIIYQLDSHLGHSIMEFNDDEADDVEEVDRIFARLEEKIVGV